MKSIILLSSSMTGADWGRTKIILHNQQTRAFILAYDWFVCSKAHPFGAKVALLDKYLPQAEWKNINALATKWATEWYMQPGLEKSMTWKEINLASVVQYPWQSTLNTILRLSSILHHLINKEKPDQIELFLRDWKPISLLPKDCDPLLEIVAEQVAKQRGLKIVNHAVDSPFEISKGYSEAKSKVFSFLQEARKFSRRFRSKKSPKYSMNTTGLSQHVLFVQSAHSILEIGEQLQNENLAQSVWITMGSRTASLKIEHVDMESYIPMKYSSVYKRAVQVQSSQIADILSRLDERRFFTYSGIDLLPIIQLWIKYLLNIEFPKMVLNIYAAERFIQENNPNVVVSDNSSMSIERIFYLIARKHRIMSVELQHGILNNVSLLGFPDHYVTDYNIFWGKFDRNKQVALGGDISRFFLGGSGRFDSYFKYLSSVQPTSKKHLRRVGVTCEKLFKFYGYTGIHNSLEAIHAEYYSYILEAAKKNPGLMFSFKVRSGFGKHPLLRNIIKEYEIENYEIVEKVKPEEWLYSLSALITDFSTMGLEAMIFDVPVIILNMTGWPNTVGYETSDAVDVVQNAEELCKALADNIGKPERLSVQRAEFVRYSLADTKGSAANTTARIIAELLCKHK
jgi:glycosyltransferase involved in cell wall biosynthesis